MKCERDSALAFHRGHEAASHGGDAFTRERDTSLAFPSGPEAANNHGGDAFCMAPT
jgi:hypothetical protein